MDVFSSTSSSSSFFFFPDYFFQIIFSLLPSLVFNTIIMSIFMLFKQITSAMIKQSELSDRTKFLVECCNNMKLNYESQLMLCALLKTTEVKLQD